MKFLRDLLDKQAHHFEKGGKLEKLYPLFEANDTVLFTPGEVTKGPTHVRDALDLKRMMIVVVAALVPCVFMAMYNTGYQANLAISQGAAALGSWQETLYASWLGLAYDPNNLFANLLHGAIYFIPVWIMTGSVGGNIEVATSIVRKHEVNEGFLVTWFLFPLTLPPTIPLWQVGLGIAFGVLVGKELFGGTGMNVLNPALTGRAFLFFAYPGQISGEKVWIAAQTSADGVSGATHLANAFAQPCGPGATCDYFAQHAAGGELWMQHFLGFVPGSMGETSALACLIGAGVLVLTQIGSWRTMLGVLGGTFAMATVLNAVGSDTNAMFQVPFAWHLVLGGWALGAVFMATDPVTSAFTATRKFIYGFGIGVLVVLVRVVNPAYPEGMMLAILFMNMFAPLIDHFFVQANIKRREARVGT